MQDDAYEGQETFELMARNTGGQESTVGSGTIVDYGTGTVWVAIRNALYSLSLVTAVLHTLTIHRRNAIKENFVEYNSFAFL